MRGGDVVVSGGGVGVGGVGEDKGVGEGGRSKGVIGLASITVG